MTGTDRSPHAVSGLAALMLLLAGCTGSSGGKGATDAASRAATTAVGASPAASGGPTGTGAQTTGAGSSGAVPRRPLRAMTVQGPHATYTVRVWAEDSSTNCAARAYGPSAPTYLRAHTCRRVVRYLATSTAGGRNVGISGSTVTFGGGTSTAGRSAAGFAALLSDPANGGIDDLFRDGKRLPDGPSTLPTDHAGNARNDAATVAVVNAWYLSGSTRSSDPSLGELLEAVT